MIKLNKIKLNISATPLDGIEMRALVGGADRVSFPPLTITPTSYEVPMDSVTPSPILSMIPSRRR